MRRRRAEPGRARWKPRLRKRIGAWIGSWRGASHDDGRLASAPSAQEHHRLFAAWTLGRRCRRGLGRFDGLEGFFTGLPGVALGLGQQRALLEKGANAVEFLAGGGMKPAEEAHPMIALGKDVLEEAAQ
jgi:hypothetical protein